MTVSRGEEPPAAMHGWSAVVLPLCATCPCLHARERERDKEGRMRRRRGLTSGPYLFFNLLVGVGLISIFNLFDDD